mgnify:FL=1
MILLFYTAISFLVSFLFFPVFIKLLRQWKVFDESGGHKIHLAFTPSMGGLSIFLGAIVTLLICLSLQQWIALKFFFVSIALMFFIGLRDDILALSARQKLYSQLLPIAILIILGQTMVRSTYGLVWDQSLPMWAAVVLTAFIFVILTNAYNLIDGLDGLAGTVGVLILSFFGGWFFAVGDVVLSYIAFAFVGGLLSFLFFNWQPAKIFMGDTGTLMIGFLISFLALTFIDRNYSLPHEHPFKFSSSIGTAVCILIIPVFDTCRVIILRLRKFQSPFQADRNHVHHQFLNLGFSHSRTVVCMAAINMFFVGLAVVLKKFSDWWTLGSAVAICLIINFALRRAQSRAAV